jgi:hypothetical protein
MQLSRITFNLSLDEVALLQKIKAKLEPIDGPLTNVAVIRKAIRALAKGLEESEQAA